MKNPDLDDLFSNASLWRPEADALRKILLCTGLDEAVKWGKPCYSFEGSNICIIQRMKGFLTLLFFKGALLDDPHAVLERQGANSHHGYRMRFTRLQEVNSQKEIIKGLVASSMEVERAGLKTEPSPEPELPDELAQALAVDPELKEAFEKLTPGRRRGYLLHFNDARQSQTRMARIERNRQKILNGKGLQDRD